MKILILSDIHANWYALEAILDKETYDALVFLGDVVDFGPSPRNCTKFLMKSSKGHFWGVRGDHDHAMAYGIESSIDSMNFELVHGSDLDPGHFCKCQNGTIESNDIYNDDEMEGESELNFILVGHSHKPFVKSVGKTTILNPGSVGQPRDLNPRASYAVIDNGNAYIKRVSYDIERTVNDLERSALPKKLTSKLSSMLHSGGIIN